MNITIADTIEKGMNNPECAFFVGAFAGRQEAIALIGTLLVVGLIYNVGKKLALEPLVEWCKKKIYGKPKEEKE